MATPEAPARKTYKVVTATGERTVTGTKAQHEGIKLLIYDGEDLVGSFINVTDFFVEPSAPSA